MYIELASLSSFGSVSELILEFCVMRFVKDGDLYVNQGEF